MPRVNGIKGSALRGFTRAPAHEPLTCPAPEQSEWCRASFGFGAVRGSALRGFTLVEMMLVAAILAVIGLTIVSTFAGGLNILYRMENYSAAKADVLISMEKMERDLRNIFAYTGINFIGSSRKMSFPGLLRRISKSGAPEDSIGLISYYLDDSTRVRALSRADKKYTQAVKEEDDGRGDVTRLAPIEDIGFKYYSYDADAGSYSWVSSWNKSEEIEEEREENSGKAGDVPLKDRVESLPLGVKIEISYKDGGRTVTMNRAVFIQPAVSLNLAKIRAAEKTETAEEAKSE